MKIAQKRFHVAGKGGHGRSLGATGGPAEEEVAASILFDLTDEVSGDVDGEVQVGFRAALQGEYQSEERVELFEGDRIIVYRLDDGEPRLDFGWSECYCDGRRPFCSMRATGECCS